MLNIGDVPETSELALDRVSLGNAIQIWALCQERDNVTVAEAALTFNCAPALARLAIEGHYWLFLDGEVICHEGD